MNNYVDALRELKGKVQRKETLCNSWVALNSQQVSFQNRYLVLFQQAEKQKGYRVSYLKIRNKRKTSKYISNTILNNS